MTQDQSYIELQVNNHQIHLFYLANSLRSFFKQECETTLTQYRILAILEMSDCGLRVSDIVSLLHTSLGTVSVNISSLVSRGLLRRTDGFDSSRLTVFKITESGRRVFDEVSIRLTRFINNTVYKSIGQFLRDTAERIATRSIANLLENMGSGSVVCSSYALVESVFLFEGSLRELCHEYDLSVLEYCLLNYLNEDYNDEKLSDIASYLLVSPSHLACAIRSLTRRSDILKKRLGIDSRVFSLDLTIAGFTEMEQISNCYYQIVKSRMLYSSIEHMAVSKIVHLNLDDLRNQSTKY